MLTANGWKDYEVIDAAAGEKLERWGDYVLLRPDPQVIWNTPKEAPEWKRINARYHRSSKGGGSWEFFDLPDVWSINYDLGCQSGVKDINPGVVTQPAKRKTSPSIVHQPGSSEPAESLRLTFNLKPMNFKHTGLFPEQAVNWEWFSKIIREEMTAKGGEDNGASEKHSKKGTEIEGSPKDADKIKVLNLFAYTGAATIAAANSGAHVTHVDSSAGMVKWAKENAAASNVPYQNTRWIIDDCTKFVEREIRRGNKYDAIIMDPPSYGRGPKGEIWKMEDNIFGFIKKCAELLSDKALFFLINSYTTGLQPAVLTYMLSEVLISRFGGSVFSDEIGLPVTSSGLILPAGACGRWER